MTRADSVHAWGLGALVAALFAYACAKDEAGPVPDDEAQRSQTQHDGGARDHDASPSASSEDARVDEEPEDEDAASQPACAEPIPDGELQNQASGPSVFGRVVSGEYGWYDVLGDSTCGVEGVRICVFDTEICTESDAAGQFVLNDVPSEADVELSYQKAGFSPALRLAHVRNAPINLRRTRILSDESRLGVLDELGLEDEPNRGGLVAVPLSPGEAVGTATVSEGVTITVMPGGARGYYSLGMLEPQGLSSDAFDPSLEATQPGGWILFPLLEPGDYTVRFERDGELCSGLIPGFGFGVDGQGHVRVRVRPGFNTAGVAALCP